MGPIVALFKFTVRQTLQDRKILLTLLILGMPCVLVLLIRSLAAPPESARAIWKMYHSLVQFLLLMGLVPLVCMVHGAGLIGSEVEARTFMYLTTRRMRRGTVLSVKFVATALVLVVLCDLGMVGLHLATLAGEVPQSLLAQVPASPAWHPTSDLRCYLLVIPAGVVSFLAVFTLIGLISGRPLGLSVGYLITVELILGNMPFEGRVYSLVHHLRVTMAGSIPRLSRIFGLPGELRDYLYPEGGTGLPTLIGVVIIALVLSMVLVSLRELMPTRVSRE